MYINLAPDIPAEVAKDVSYCTANKKCLCCYRLKIKSTSTTEKAYRNREGVKFYAPSCERCLEHHPYVYRKIKIS